MPVHLASRRLPVWGLLILLAPACSDYGFTGKSSPEVGEEADPVPEIMLSPDPVDFGTLDEATTVSQVVTIRNPGEGTLQISAVRIDGPAVFSLTSPEADELEADEQTTLVVSYAPTEELAAHEGRLDVSSNADGRPTASVQLLGAIELSALDSGEPGPDEETECACPDGFEPTEDDSLCFRETQTPATATGEVVEVCAVTPYVTYGMYGARYPGGASTQDAYWGQNDSISNGRLNEVGVWGCVSSGSTVAGSNPVGSWIGFSVCVDVASDGDYLLGLGGDNRVRFAVDGTQIMEQSDDQTRNFNYWWMHTISLTAGTHILDIEGYNAGSIAAFGAELSGPFAAGSLTQDADMQAADYAGHIIWDTNDAIGNAFPLGDTVSWECPDGTVLEGCEEPMCIGREEEPCL